MKTKEPKTPKVKISEIDLKTFLVESIKIDPYWEDLYNPKLKFKRHGQRNNG